MKKTSSISVIIPTRNRLVSLNRILNSIENQTVIPIETIIVDSSDPPLKTENLNVYNTQNIRIIHSAPSVCRQRNIGIENSTSEYIFLCDDDIELSENYCETLGSFLDTHQEETIVSGLILEKGTENWNYAEKDFSTIGLLMAYVFGFSVGFDIHNSKKKPGFLTKRFLGYYQKKGNSIAQSGWPIIVDFGNEQFTTPIYGLGASIIRKKALRHTVFDEAFYAHGIGDNYDLAVGLNAPINVIKKAKAYHHREADNRMDKAKSYYFRINALHYILLKHDRFKTLNLIYFTWSLFGKSIEYSVRGKFRFVPYNLEVILRILFNQTLYKTKN